MSSQTLALLGLALLLGGLGVLHFIAKDWLWDRHETQMRAKGLVNLERTAEWDQQQTLLGAALVIVALVLVGLTSMLE